MNYTRKQMMAIALAREIEDGKTGSIREEDMELVAYVHGKYCAVGKTLGFFGYSVASPDALKRRKNQKPSSKGKEKKG